jgi:hypothetical protein
LGVEATGRDAARGSLRFFFHGGASTSRILHRSARAVEMEERVCVVVTTTRQMVERGILANDLTFYNRSEGNVF